MHGLEKGINQLANWEINQTVRKNAIEQLNGVIDDLNKGIGIWKDMLDKGIPKSETGRYGGWAGFTVESKLFELELDARNKAKQASNGQSSLDKPLVALAYGMLPDSQTAEDAANDAIHAMGERITQVKSLIKTIQNTKPKKPAASKSSASKSGAKKTVKAKTTAKKKSTAKKNAPQKKVAKKKAVKKKALKKKTSKKKAAGKKAAKKKAPTKKRAPVKKKAPAKKASKKKATKKATSKKKTVKKKKTKRR